MRVVVTGASGFVGHAFARRLPALGHQMVAVSRSAPPPGATAAMHWAGVTDGATLRRALEGADALVHLAARVHVMRDRSADPIAAFRAVNVEGARVAAAAAREAGVPRAVLMSSIKVVGEGRDMPYGDADPPDPRDPYGVSKREAELVFAEGFAGGGWTILRPPLVYGAGVRGNFARMLQLGIDWAGVPLPLGGALGRRSLVYADNLADAVIAALGAPATAGRAYVVADAEQPTAAELLRTIGRLAGRRAILVPVPPAILRAAASVAGRAAEVARLTRSLTVDASGLRRDAGWTQAVALEEGLARTVAWWRARHGGGA